jgi:N-acetylglutamate synthase
MPYHIRRLDISDYDEMVRVWAEAGLPFKPRGRESRESIARELAFPGARFLGLFENDRMVGVVIANWDGRRGWINRLAIDPDRRGLGLAGKLIRECESFFEQQGAQVMTALIDELNTPSMATFEKEGYECVSQIRMFRKRRSAES